MAKCPAQDKLLSTGEEGGEDSEEEGKGAVQVQAPDSADEGTDENHNVPSEGPGQDAFYKMFGYEENFSTQQ